MIARRWSIRAGAAAALAAGAPAPTPALAGDFADAVLEYRPGPGQFVNDPSPFTGGIFNDPSRALGPPVGGGTTAPDNAKLVTLGSFGGSITLAFAATVLDDPCNPFGLDAIVFGNGFYPGGNPGAVAGEFGVVEISLDVNGNGLADDAWYVIPGSLLPSDPPAVVPADAALTVTWDNDPATPEPPEPALIDSWYPRAALYPGLVGPGLSSYDTSGFALPAAAAAPVVGHADVAPTLLLGDLDADDAVDDPAITPEEFYTRPDNPHAIGVTPGSGGGDAFDIAWAVDPATGAPAGLIGFDFVRISTGVDTTGGALGEVSTEVGAVADVRPDAAFFDADASGDVGVEDLYAWHASPVDYDGDGLATEADRVLLARCVRRGEGADTGAGR